METQQGDFSAYIPTNLTSITDGQIYLERDLFHQGFRPAINVGLSVSRVGGKAQLKAMKSVALKLRLELAQYREVAAFAKLTSELDDATQQQIHRGERLAEILKQPQSQPLPVPKQVFIMWTASEGALDDIPLQDIARFEKEWFALLDNAYPALSSQLLESGVLSDDIIRDLKASLVQFKAVFITTGTVESADQNQPPPAEPTAVMEP